MSPYPPMTFAARTAARLLSAGIRPDDPGLAQLREWNAGAAARQQVSVETRRGQFGATRHVRLDDLAPPPGK
jgi:hypothetical protein